MENNRAVDPRVHKYLITIYNKVLQNAKLFYKIGEC